MKREEEKRRWAEEERVAILRQQMEELKLGELEAKKLKKEQEDLLRQQWEVEELEEDRKKMEDRRKKTELGHFLSRQYNAQMKRRAQLVQAELEMDMRILTELVSKEGDDQRLRSARREQAAADAAWMKRVIEEQLHVERQREAELDTLFREEAKQVWAKREAEWERERNARDRLMKEGTKSLNSGHNVNPGSRGERLPASTSEVLTGRQLQIQDRIEQNQRAQKDSLLGREQLIRELEEAKHLTSREKKDEEGQKSARRVELEAQISERRLQEKEAMLRLEVEDREERLAEEQQNDLLQQEAEIMTHRGYQKKLYSRPRTAWS
ncbi:hypothetical protein FKM82_017667 [Ascaphus truei]